MWCSFCLESPSRLACLAVSDSTLRLNSKSLTLWHFPDTSLPSGRGHHYLYKCYLYPLYIYLPLHLSFCTVMPVHRSVLLLDWESRSYIFLLIYSQYLAECLALRKYMLNYKWTRLISNCNCRILYDSHITSLQLHNNTEKVDKGYITGV